MQGHLSEHVPPSARSDRDLIASLEQRILKLYGKLKGYSSEDSRRAYVSTCRAIPVYGAAYFEARPKTTEYPSQVVLAVTATSLLVVDPSSRAVLKSFSYGSVVTWGHSSFVVRGRRGRRSITYQGPVRDAARPRDERPDPGLRRARSCPRRRRLR